MRTTVQKEFYFWILGKLSSLAMYPKKIKDCQRGNEYQNLVKRKCLQKEVKKQKKVRIMEKNQMIAVCGLNCSECDIFRASDNPEIAQRIVNWFKEERHIDVKIEDIHCLGCREDRTKHWSPDCWILRCCVDEKGLEFCYQCEDFPCEKLSEWAKESKKYEEALNRLKEMGKRQ